MKIKISNIIKQAVNQAYTNKDLPSKDLPEINVEEPKKESHGDFSTNIAMISAKTQKMAPRKIAEAIIKNINDSDGIILKTEIAGPGFINFYLEDSAWHSILKKVHDKQNKYGLSQIGQGKKVMVEFVSANPTGPLHVGHGRGAVVGDVLANILSACGYDVSKEYYINDAGRQILTLGRSVYLRYKELCGEKVDFPEDCYQGDYIKELALEKKNEKGRYLLDMKTENAVLDLSNFAAERILKEIKKDLSDFGIKFDCWFSEQSLYDKGSVQKAIEDCQKKNLIYEKDGACWFKTTDFGDEKDRVVIRQNKQTTYFASDIAYHQNKFHRGFDVLVDVWGADHHGYIPRLSAAVQAQGFKKDQFNVVLVQLVNLLRGGEPVAMSTRAGEFVTLKQVLDEVGKDAARFLFLMRHHDSHLDFDLELACKRSNDNPVYYVQYVHARIASIIRKAQEQDNYSLDYNENNLEFLTEPEEKRIIKILSRYPEVLENSARLMEPHRITYYLTDLASNFHSYYNKHRVITDDSSITCGRIILVRAVQIIIKNGLSLLGVTAPERM